MAKILIIEDAADIAALMAEWLSFSDFTVEMSHNGQEAADRLIQKYVLKKDTE